MRGRAESCRQGILWQTQDYAGQGCSAAGICWAGRQKLALARCWTNSALIHMICADTLFWELTLGEAEREAAGAGKCFGVVRTTHIKRLAGR